MPWVFGAAAVVLVAACGSAERGDGHTTCDFVTFVRFEGVRYVPSRLNEGVDRITLGWEYGRVERTLSRETGTCDNYQPADGDATDVSVGTPFYTVEGYRPQFLIATEIGLWEADYAPAARTGGDVLDIGGRVSGIVVFGDASATVELGVIDESTAIGAFFEAVLDAPIVRDTDQRGSFERYLLRFEMKDGLVFTRMYRPDTGELWNGIMLPDTARAIITDAVAR